MNHSKKPRGDYKSSILSKLFKFILLRKNNEPDSVREAIEELIEEQPKTQSIIDEQERILLSNVLKQRNASIEHIMVPRTDIVATKIETPIDETIKLLVEQGHSRMPVYRGSLDDVIGMVHIKDLTGLILNKDISEKDTIYLSKVMRRVIFSAPSTRVLDLLLEMRIKRTHMAVVVDEHGGIDGLVTIEDLVEQIIGDISDEHDEESEPEIIKKSDGTILVDARVTLDEFSSRFGDNFTPEEISELDTLGGVLFRLCGRIPNIGELITSKNGAEFEVIDADPRRIRRLRIRNLKENEETKD